MIALNRDPLLQALDRLDAPVHFFIRDDDTGWAGERLMALLRLMDAVGVPIDLAAIPTAVHPELAHELWARRNAGQAIGIHQHGFAHTNHEGTGGRRCEFGAAREPALREADLRRGREQLQVLFLDELDPFFTPPWNRVSADTPAMLAALGFTVLSRDVTATPQHALPEIAVHADWSKQWRLASEGRSDAAHRIAEDLAQHVQDDACIGLMLHHAVMSDAELEALRGLLAGWSRHPKARWVLMRDVASARPFQLTGTTSICADATSILD